MWWGYGEHMGTLWWVFESVVSVWLLMVNALWAYVELSWVFGEHMMSVWWVYGERTCVYVECILNIWWIYGECMVCLWWAYGESMVRVKWKHGVWWVCGKCIYSKRMVNLWWVYGDCVVSVSWMYGEHMVSLWCFCGECRGESVVYNCSVLCGAEPMWEHLHQSRTLILLPGLHTQSFLDSVLSVSVPY